MLQAYIQREGFKAKDIYYNLTRVLRFDNLCKECIIEMYQVCETQLSFLTHLQQSTIVDFNTLDRAGDKLLKHAHRAEEIWKKIVDINSTHQKAKVRYASYLKEVRNDLERSTEIMRSCKDNSTARSLESINQGNSTLFDEDTVIVHVSGNKSELGRILKVSTSVENIFGFTSIELQNSYVNKMMPLIIGKHHNQLMENYLKTGKSKIFNKERYLYGQHKDGYCFQIRLFVRTIPNIKSGVIQFVGMIIKIIDNYEYVLTDTKGVISSMTKNLAELLGIKFKWLQKNLNVQLLAPELIEAYKNEEEFKEGYELEIVIPEGLVSYLESQDLEKSSISSHTLPKGSIILTKYNSLLNTKTKGIELTPEDLWSLKVYDESTFVGRVKYYMQKMTFTITESK